MDLATTKYSPFFSLFPKATRGLNLISYRGVLVSTLLHATVYMFLHNLLNVLVQIANKMGLQKKFFSVPPSLACQSILSLLPFIYPPSLSLHLLHVLFLVVNFYDLKAMLLLLFIYATVVSILPPFLFYF
jgi:hypothetical protein